MPQKLNKAGKMQDYIPKGNGDASGEYGTSNGTNKNFTTSDKKKTEANVITENKSVVVENKGKPKTRPFKEWIEKDGNKERLEKGVKKWVENKSEKTAKEMVEENIKNYQEQEYNGYTIGNLYGDKYDVSYMGDDVLFDTVDEAKAFIDEITGKKPDKKETKANVIDNDLTKGVDKGKSATRKDKYGNPLVSDEAFKVGYEAGKKYLDEMTKYYDKDKLLMSNVFLGYLNSEINKGIEEAGLDENYDMTYQDANEIIGSLLNVNVDMEEYERGFTPSKVYKGGKYTGYKPKDLK